MASSRNHEIVDFLLGLNLNEKQLVIALREAASHHSVRKYFVSAGLIPTKEALVNQALADRVARFMEAASKTAKKEGRVNDTIMNMLKSVLVANIKTPPQADDGSAEYQTGITYVPNAWI